MLKSITESKTLKPSTKPHIANDVNISERTTRINIKEMQKVDGTDMTHDLHSLFMMIKVS